MVAKASAPCTMGNFGPGFDVLSLALDLQGDTVTLAPAERDEVAAVTGAGADRVPREWARNAACGAVDALRRATGRTGALSVRIEKGVRPGSGLGSSASSCAAAVLAFARHHRLVLPSALALDAAAAGEAVATGAAHQDDVAAALYGGLTIVGGPQVVRLRPPPLHIVVALPDVELPTREMRALIPSAIPRADAVHNIANVARIVHACHAQDAEMLCGALEDRISRPYRAPRVPGFGAMRDAALDAGARAFVLSGSGPAVAAIMPATVDPRPVADALRKWGEVFVTRPAKEVDDPALPLH